MDASTKLAQSQDLAAKVASLLRKRLESAAGDYRARVRAAHERYAKACESARATMNPQQSWTEPYYYAIDFFQRSILFWDALRQRGNDYVERETFPVYYRDLPCSLPYPGVQPDET